MRSLRSKKAVFFPPGAGVYSAAMEARLILSILGLGLSLPVALGMAIASRKPGARRPWLALVLLEAGLYFLAELLASLLGRSALPLVLNFASAFYGMPALYLYAREVLGEGRSKTLGHFLPALINLPLGGCLALAVAGRGFRGDSVTAVYLVLAELGQTVQLIAYGRAGLALTRPEAGPGREWPRRIVLAALAGYGAFLALAWSSLGITLASEVLGRPIPIPRGLDLSSLVTVVLLAWTMGLCALWGRDAATAATAKPDKYGGRPLSKAEAAALVARARALLAAEADLASPGVEPRRLADRLGEPYYLLSRAVNEGEGMTIGDLVNGYRVERAKALLRARREMGILEVALESGFQAKSTFNEVFRKATGMSPRDYREGP